MRKNVSQRSLIEYGTFSTEDLVQINKCRGMHNKLGFGYQLAFIRLLNYLPGIKPFEVMEEILIYSALQLEINTDEIKLYEANRTKVSDHQQEIIKYLNYILYNATSQTQLEQFVFNEALRLEAHSLLRMQAINFLKANNILLPTENTINRLISSERKKARKHIFEIIHEKLPNYAPIKLNDLLIAQEGSSKLERLKKPPQKASPDAIIDLSERLQIIKDTNILQIDLSDINNNYQKIFTKEIRLYSVNRIRALEPDHRIAALVCFLHQAYQDITDFLVETYCKLLNGAFGRAEAKVNAQFQQHEASIRQSINNYEKLKATIADMTIPDVKLRSVIFKKFPKEFEDAKPLDIMSKSKSTHIFDIITDKFSYFRQFSPYVIANLDLQFDSKEQSDVIEAVKVLKDLNSGNKRKLDADTPIKFIPKNLKKHIVTGNQINRHAWECALLFNIRDGIKNNNITVNNSKRHCKFQEFFMPDDRWIALRKAFFTKTRLPQSSQEVEAYLTARLNNAFDQYLENAKYNKYAKIIDGKWSISPDPAYKLTEKQVEDLKLLKKWIASHLRTIKLPDLLVEVDNDLQFTESFMLPNKKGQRFIEDICKIIITIMSHGCNIGAYSMSQLADDISYEEIKNITDWQLTDDTQRMVLALIVNAISCLGISKNWGEGKTSSSDAHLVAFHEKVLQQGYSLRFGDFALAFYTFIADNYAPLYSEPIECNEGEAPYALDGIINNESDLNIEEHYTDTRGASFIIFTAFEFLGPKFNPRIRGIQKQNIFRIDRDRDYGILAPLFNRKSNIKMSSVTSQWDRMAQFYASISNGHITASVALKRLHALGPKNEFYDANVQLGKVLKTENTLQNMIDPEMRKRRHRGLLKGEEMHQLARNISYGNGGVITARDLIAQRNCCNCLTLIMACIVYWQAKEIARILSECYDPQSQELDLSLLQHISPVGWDNVILYGEYIINKNLIRR